MPLTKYVKEVPNFPIPGVNFKDITPLLRDNLPGTIKAMGEKIHWDSIDLIMGIESRGFILGSALSVQYNKGFVPIRKKGKLPPPVISYEYQLEYGTDTLEMSPDVKGSRILIVDDVLATGGTLEAAVKLCEKANHKVVDMLVLIDLTFLNEFDYKGQKCKSVLQYHTP